MVVAAGAVSAAASVPPIPFVVLIFALSSAVFAAALILAARVTIALASARRTRLAAFAAGGRAANTATPYGEYSAATEMT